MIIKGFDAAIFDLDGVITDTASLHSEAWKNTFDRVLALYSQDSTKNTKPFSIQTDYLNYVDGKPRYEGVRSFLESRNIFLEQGNSSDIEGMTTYCAIGNLKNKEFNALLKSKGVQVFSSTVSFIENLIAHDIKIAVASSSKNCNPILKKQGLSKFFQASVDGVYSEKYGLQGKPCPDIFITACEKLGAEPSRCIVVEDAVSGVEAAKNGNFGLVVGIARHNNHRELKSSGADIVVSDLEELGIETLNTWFETGLNEDNWCIKFNDFVPKKQKHRESLLTVGNGYFASRGSMCEAIAGKHHYPATYMSGVYNTLPSVISGKTIYNEDFVNCPDWIFTTFRIDDEQWIQPEDVKIIDIERRLDFRTGFLSGWMLIEDKQGRQTMLETIRFASMDNCHIAALEHSVTPLNYEARISICTSLSASHINDGVERYRELNQKHLANVHTGHKGAQHWLTCSTSNSATEISLIAHVSVPNHNCNLDYINGEDKITAVVSDDIKPNQDFVIQKTVALVNSQTHQKTLEYAKKELSKDSDFEVLALRSRKAWHKIWNITDIQIEGDRKSQKLVRLNTYHLLVTASEHTSKIDVGIPARGLHGEAYRGHIFWDEVFILPFYNVHFPEVTRSVLQYRYNRLDAARRNTKENGYRGAMFPWQSAGNGNEQTQIIHFNPVSGQWDPDYSSLQRHVSLAIALNIVRYYENTGDKAFMCTSGMEMLYEICRFWASATELGTDKKFHVYNIMGPDEFHEKYPDNPEGGVTDNAYTNIMCVWLWNKTLKLTSSLGDKLKDVFERIGLEFFELDEWQNISTKLNIPVIDNKILEQFAGFNQLEELNWQSYTEKYGNIGRLDRILKAEGKSPDSFKLTKQADTLMAFYLLNQNELSEIAEDHSLDFSREAIQHSFEYYYSRCTHGSTLSSVVHSQLASELGMQSLAWQLFKTSLESDYTDIQGGTTGEGIHTGAMSGSVLLLLNSFAGIKLKGNTLSINPALPEHWHSIKCKISFRHTDIELIIFKDCLNIKASKDIGIRIQDVPLVIEKDDWWNIDL
ncbi:MAG: beta-phosphoglucomutase family hydrolase [Bacteroidales bacterium]|nr:beta-phosphoglucomutase family hydrolase [Bacteroidales bacterium]HOY38881.1 beta-phosphoglucomutase family hydrolase [Bacteroidales bacterium]HQP04718.1 beta-phosphoglucomutase family hydrolase [Bacteroidales bacterium]